MGVPLSKIDPNNWTLYLYKASLDQDDFHVDLLSVELRAGIKWILKRYEKLNRDNLSMDSKLEAVTETLKLAAELNSRSLVKDWAKMRRMAKQLLRNKKEVS